MAPMAGRDEAAQQKTFLKFVMFGLGRERYAVPVLKVKEIIQSAKVFPLPKMPAFIEGILSLRGDIIPIVGLRKRFDLPAVEKTEESRIIVLEMEKFFVGISVDQVFEVIKMEEESIEPPPPLVGGLRADFLDGVCEIEGHLITILNLEQIFSSTERVMLAEAAGAPDEEPAPRPKAPSKTEKRAAKGAGPEARPVAEPPAREAAVPAAPRLSGPEDVRAGADGKLQVAGRSYYVGTRFAGQTLRVEPGEEGGIVVRSEAGVIKKFRA